MLSITNMYVITKFVFAFPKVATTKCLKRIMHYHINQKNLFKASCKPRERL